ncbi:MAG: hypothetical protein GY774_05470, partial [Planctomycetes bacterium]|nr:hypothetical protein [Planctomycetota bacterium]
PATTNHSSATNHPSHVDKYIHTELKHRAMLGPFRAKPFSWTMISPLMTREKSGSNDRRVIMDLSHPKGQSVNDGIDRDTYLGEQFKLLLPNALTLRDRIRQEGEGAYMWGRDLSRSYRQLRSCPLDYPLLGLTWNSYFFIDLAVPFRLSHGAKCMQDVTQSVVDILATQNLYSVAYIDDIAGANANIEQADEAFTKC